MKMSGQVKATFTDFPDYTSIHGIGGVKRGRYIIQRLLWVVVFCGSFGMCIFQVYRLAKQFSREQTTTKMSEEYGAVPFPDLRLCNLNPLLFTEVKKDMDLIQVIEETAKAVKADMDLLGIPRNLVYERNYTVPIAVDDKAAAIQNAKSSFRIRMGEKADHEIAQMAQRSEDFIMDCFFQDTECERSTFRDEYYGMCHKIEVDDLIYNAGPQNGLTMTLNTQSNEHIPFITESAGLILDIHPHGQITSIKASGMVLSTGFEFSIGLRATKYERYAGKSERCLENGKNTEMAYCVEQCLGHLAARQCQCTDDYNYRLSTGKTDDFFCKSSLDFECIAGVKRLDSGVECSHCKVPCRETVYDKSLTMAKWPASTQEIVLQDILNMTQVSRDDLLTIRIYFSSLSTTTITEELAYTEENFVSDIGGQLGLWAGISVLSLAEILELLVLVSIACCSKRKTQDSTNVTADTEEKPKLTL